MRRREFVTLLGSAVAARSFATAAENADRQPRIEVVMAYREGDPDGQANLSRLAEGFTELGWIDGRTLRMGVHWWGSGDIEQLRALAKQLVDTQPDLIVSHGTPVTAAFHQVTRTIPIVFVSPADPVGSGFTASLSRPGGNLTGLLFSEATMAGKLLELLTHMAPRVRRMAVIFNPDTAPSRGSFYLPFFESAVQTLKLEPIIVPVHGDIDIETAISTLAREPAGGLVAMPDPFLVAHRAAIISQAARSSVPAISFNAIIARDGGLLSYGPNLGDIFRRAGPYVDRILRGSKPADLPVQAPIKFEMAINARTARSLGLVVPPDLLALADEVIE
jgi:putative tryptophan/tyrosine transport system substrate-binding protein